VPAAQIVDVGNLPGFANGSPATDHTERGMVVGFLNESSGESHAYVYERGQLTDIDPGGRSSAALAVSSRGTVVGRFTPVIGPRAPFVYEGGILTLLPTLGGASGEARAVNENGYIAGRAALPSGLEHAFLLRDDTMTDLGTLGGQQSTANAVNVHAEVVGRSDIGGGLERAFLYKAGEMNDLGPLGGLQSVATDIADDGTVVGFAATTLAGLSRAFIYRDDSMLDLLGTGSRAFGINAKGEVVGILDPGGPFLYRRGEYVALNDLPLSESGWELTEATSISEDGRISGTGLHNGLRRGFLLTVPQALFNLFSVPALN
jgi:probable HAF family extracellular repeat protein